MPRGDGTGPTGNGPKTGQGSGRSFRPGPGGYCVCVVCGEKSPHQQGRPCVEQLCPKCGATMSRDKTIQ